MEIVIKIHEKDYQAIKNGYILFSVLDAIMKGKPLPEHHGDLVDRDAIEVLRIGIIKREYDKGFDAGVSCMVNSILETPTIIEADKESEE